MEVVVGFFGRLEYVTSGEAAFTKTAEFVRQARNITKRGEARRRPPKRVACEYHQYRQTRIQISPPARAPLLFLST